MIKTTKLTDPGSLRAWLEDSCKEGASEFCLDLETTGLGKKDSILSAAITGPDEFQVAFFGPELLPELMSAPEGVSFLGQNFSFDLKYLSWAGVRLQDKYDYTDTLILSFLLNENINHSLGAQVTHRYGDDYKKDFWTKFKKAEEAPEEELSRYNSLDVHYTMRLARDLRRELEEQDVPQSIIEHVHRTQKSLLETEIAGIKLDMDYLMAKGLDLKTKINTLLPGMRALVEDEAYSVECDLWIKEIDKKKSLKGKAAVKKPEFSFDSSKQVMALLYDKLGLPTQLSEKTKKPTCDDDALESIKNRHPVVEKIQEYRDLQKIYGTYIKGTIERQVDGRIYPSFNSCGAATGRLSHQNPNMANLPNTGGIRGMFVPDEGYVFVTADYASLEVYIEAHFTGDKNLLKLIETGMSKHDLTASEVGIDRPTAKTVNFLAQYHGTSYKLSKVLNIDRPAAQKILDKYWEAYGGCRAFKEFTDKCVNEGTPIIYPTGRRRRFDKKPRKEWDGDYRAAYNSPIQGTGSDCMSWAFYVADEKLRKLGWGRGGWTVHDEGIMMVKSEYKEEGAKLLVETMVGAGRHFKLNVELKAEPCIMEERWDD